MGILSSLKKTLRGAEKEAVALEQSTPVHDRKNVLEDPDRPIGRMLNSAITGIILISIGMLVIGSVDSLAEKY